VAAVAVVAARARAVAVAAAVVVAVRAEVAEAAAGAVNKRPGITQPLVTSSSLWNGGKSREVTHQ